MRTDIPYFCQWESPELAGRIVAHKVSTDDDPRWQASGARTKQEYHDWSWSACGMACTKMILAHRTGKVAPIVELGKTCAAYGGYVAPLKTSIGLYFKPYVTFAAQELGWKARIVQGMTQHELLHELGKGNYVIAGVSSRVRDPRSSSRTKSGHLVLMTGYDKARQEFYLHNPSGTTPESQANAAVAFSDFKKFFSGRSIVIQGDEATRFRPEVQ